MAKCMICGEEAKLCCPLTFCDKCRGSEEADKIRVELKEWFKKNKKGEV